MTSSASTPEQIDSRNLYLKISASTLTSSSSNSAFSNSGSRWRAYLNQVCLNAVLPWLQEEIAQGARVWTHPRALPSFWEATNGTAIELEGMRLVLVPTAAIDLSELRVPQEWVDIPLWVADYYVGIQVNSDDGWLRIYGYATHLQLKTQGTYDDGYRSYILGEEEFIHNLSMLWVTRQIGATEPQRATIDSLAPIPLAQAENLLARLGKPDVIFPRLAVPFQLWGALLEHGGWRQQLYERRQGMTEQWSVPRWLSGGAALARQVGWEWTEVQPVRAGIRSTRITLSRQLRISDNLYELRIIPQRIPEENIWQFELRCSEPNCLIPQGFKLRLLTEDLQPFENNEDTAATDVEQLVIEVIMHPGEGLVWETEPLPDDYDREVLRF